MRELRNVTDGTSQRRGLSIVESVGCLVALSGGVVLGSMYLGVDVKTATLGAIRRSDLIDLSRFGLPASQETENTTEADTTPDEQEAATDEARVTNMDDPNEQGQPSNEGASKQQPSQPASVAEGELTEEERQAATRTCWTRLTAAMQEEAAGRQMVVRDPENWQLFDYLTHRRAGHQKAVKAIERLDEAGVDHHLIVHVRQILSWHLAGVQIFGRAVDLLTDGPAADLAGPYAQSWQSAATQHRMEAKLINEKHLGVASYLDHTYKSLAPFKPVLTP